MLLEGTSRAGLGGFHAQPTSPDQRIHFIDGWRALAVVLVVINHYGIAVGHPPPVQIGRTGVHIFFLISGFIITWLSQIEIARTGRFDRLSFFARRALRILPPLALYLIVAMMVHWDQAGQLAGPALRAATFTCNVGVAPASCPWLFGHTWSLAFEEQFYLIFPFLLVGRFDVWAIPAVAIYLLPLLAPLDYIGRIGHLQIGLLFALGMAYARMKERVDAWLRRLPLAAYALPVLFLCWWLYLRPGRIQVTLSLVEPFAIFLIVFGLPTKSAVIRKLLSIPLLRRIGLYSYSIYLWQQLVTEQHAGWEPWHYLVGIVLAVVLAWQSYKSFEAPFRRWSARFSPGRRPAAAA